MYVHVIYMSISGNVRRFAEHLKQYALQQHCISEDSPLISLSEIRKDTSPIELSCDLAYVHCYFCSTLDRNFDDTHASSLKKI